ncbi:hypothetical protein J6590_095473, partial [Homalodisca vitripennis]
CASVMCDCDSRIRDFCLELASCRSDNSWTALQATLRDIFPHTNTNTPELHFTNSRPPLPPLLLVLQFCCSSPASSLTTPLPNLSIIIGE